MRVALEQEMLADNQKAADFNRKSFNDHQLLAVNLMSSPGAGKTAILERTIKSLQNEFRIGVIEGDLATDLDAERVRALGAQAVQINTNGGCHLDARMVAKALPKLTLPHLDLLFIENVGNLVCPSGYDLGQTHKVAILSAPEGNDKIPKYPAMFRRTELVLLNKIDLLPFLNFNVKKAETDLQGINPDSRLIPLSAMTGDGMDTWLQWLRSAYRTCIKP